MALALACAATLFGGPGDARAQGAGEIATDPDTTLAEQEIEQERDVAADALERLRADLAAADARQAMLQSELEEINADVEELTDLLIRTTRQAQTIAERVSIQRERIGVLDRNARDLEAALDVQRTRVASLLSAMIRIGGSPPPAILISPGDALTSVRSAILLGTAFPELEAESRALESDLRALESARAELDAALDVLVADAEALAEEEARIELVLAERSRLREENQSVLERERERAALLAGEATSLEELLSELEAELASVREAMASAAATEDLPPLVLDDETARTRLLDTGRMAPAFPFSEARGLVQIPARGQRILGFGEEDRFGETSQGLHIETEPEARVIAPADGWVLYAGPFRTYGQVVILDVGEGYRMILAGMSRINVALGQFVLMGEPIATMGARSSGALADGVDTAQQPVLFVELREDGRPIDSSAWWAQRDGQRTDG